MPFNDLSIPLFFYPTAHQQTALKKKKRKEEVSSNSNKQCKRICEAVFLSFMKRGCKEWIKLLPARTEKDKVSSKPLSKMTLHFGCVAPLKINHLFHKPCLLTNSSLNMTLTVTKKYTSILQLVIKKTQPNNTYIGIPGKIAQKYQVQCVRETLHQVLLYPSAMSWRQSIQPSLCSKLFSSFISKFFKK